MTRFIYDELLAEDTLVIRVTRIGELSRVRIERPSGSTVMEHVLKPGNFECTDRWGPIDCNGVHLTIAFLSPVGT